MPRRRREIEAWIDDRLLLEICERLIHGEGATALSRSLRSRGIEISREEIYPCLKVAFERGYVHLTPPAHAARERAIADRYGVPPSRVHVANAVAPASRHHVASRAAELTIQLLRELGQRKREVHIGLGGATTMLRCAQQLTALLRGPAPELPRLVFHAIASGFDVHHPEEAPTSLLTLFEGLPIVAGLVGFYAPPAVKPEEYDRLRRSIGVAEAFQRAHEIDIVVTSVAAAEDPHGTLRRFDQAVKGFRIPLLERAGWVGDLQYQPYAPGGPIDVGATAHAMVLFDLPQLRRFVQQPDKHVVVVACPCWRCGAPKTAALRPLLECPSLAVWTHLVTDLTTADELLQP